MPRYGNFTITVDNKFYARATTWDNAKHIARMASFRFRDALVHVSEDGQEYDGTTYKNGAVFARTV